MKSVGVEKRLDLVKISRRLVKKGLGFFEGVKGRGKRVKGEGARVKGEGARVKGGTKKY